MLQPPGALPIRVLVVEDNRDICDNIAAYLEKHNFILDFAYDGISAMHLAVTHAFDVIVLDLTLPGMDGLHFCQKLRTEAKLQTPLLCLPPEIRLTTKLKASKLEQTTTWLNRSPYRSFTYDFMHCLNVVMAKQRTY